MMRLFAEMSIAELGKPADEMFRMNRVRITVPEYAPIFDSVRCSVCGEKVMQTRARVNKGKPVCINCIEEEHYILDGRGISVKGAHK